MESKDSGMRLLKKGQTGIHLLFGRMGFGIALLVAEFLLMIAIFAWFEDYMLQFYGSSLIVALVMVLYLLNKSMEPTIRNTWLVVVMAAPIFGTLMYVFTQLNLGHRMLARLTRQRNRDSANFICRDDEILAQLRKEDPAAANLCSFVSRAGYTGVFTGTKTRYFPLGEDMLQCLLPELEKAEKFIYLEFFIVGEGQMWGQILEILARKAKQGVDVRVMYDGTCEFNLLPKNYPQKLAELGISCKVFSPFKPFVSTHYNYRDHRKILVIDGHTAFNGGINLADEYININSPYGHWKDTAVMLKGPAVREFTLMFLQMWNLTEKKPDYQALEISVEPEQAPGYVMPFGDNPVDDVLLGHTVYSDMLNRATDSVRIMTPYLILDAAMEENLCYAASRGVRVQLMLPGIPDKYVPYALAKTHYKTLLDAGVEIYEYIPGFVHAKVVTTDGTEAVVGTINFDYRSFCHHYECGTYLYGVDCISDIESDFDAYLGKCRAVTYETIRKEKWHRKVVGFLLKGFAPLM